MMYLTTNFQKSQEHELVLERAYVELVENLQP